MSFEKYAGTAFSPWLLPIIPVGATLTEGSKLSPEHIGKIPGTKWPSGWSGCAWDKLKCKDSALKALDSWYKGYPCATIGMHTRQFPALDIDIDDDAVQDVMKLAFDIFGVTVVRGRPNSKKKLLLYRLDQSEDFRPITKVRMAFDNGFAVEMLGQGQQCLIEGMHPSGVQYVWERDRSPLSVGASALKGVSATQVEQFFRECRELLLAKGWQPRKMSSHMSGGGVAAVEITQSFPDQAPNLDELRKVLGILPCSAPEFEAYEDWELMLRAMKAAAGGDEQFYPDYETWATAGGQNTDDQVRGKWESHKDSQVGWSWICGLAHAYGYVGDAQALFEALGMAEGEDDADADPAAQLPRAPRPAEAERSIADRLAKQRGKKDLIYVPTSGSRGWWMQFTEDGAWQAMDTIAYDASNACCEIGDLIRTSGSATQQQLTLARSLMGAHAAENVVRILRSHPGMVVKRTELDAHPMLMGVPGGYVDAQGKLQVPRPELFITRCAGCAPDYDAVCPQWENMLYNLCNYDFEIFTALKRALGYTMTGTGREQKFFFLHGRDGNEGKTSFLELLARIMGSYASFLSDGAFTRGAGEKRFAFSRTEGVWFVYNNEVNEGEEWAEARLKERTSSGTVEIERKGVDAIAAPLHYALWFQGNHLPRFRSPDQALRRRMMVFPCETPVAKARLNWADRVFEEEGPAILAWLMAARAEYLQHGLYEPEVMKVNQDDYLEDQDHLLLFLQQCCEFDAEAITPVSELYSMWQVWRDNEGLDARRAGSRTTFSRQVIDHKLSRTHRVQRSRNRGSDGKVGRTLTGIKLSGGATNSLVE